MSILIKGQHMPRDCYECIAITYILQSGKRPPECPLVEAPDPKEFAREMRDRGNNTDDEVIHICADELMCYVLRVLGYEEGVEAFYDLPKWYS